MLHGWVVYWPSESSLPKLWGNYLDVDHSSCWKIPISHFEWYFPVSSTSAPMMCWASFLLCSEDLKIPWELPMSQVTASDCKQMLLGPSPTVKRAEESPRVHQNWDPCIPFPFKAKETSSNAAQSPWGKTMGETTLQVRSVLLWVLGWVVPPAPRAEETGSTGLQPPCGKPCPVLPAARGKHEEPEAGLFWALITRSP